MNKTLSIFTLLMVGSSANAALLEWTFDNTLFYSDGSQLSGSFLYDADTNALDTSNLTFFCDNVCSGNLASPFGQSEQFELFLFDTDSVGDQIDINLRWSSELTNFGGTVSLDFSGGGSPMMVQNLSNDGFADALNIPTSISAASAVPIPATAWLFGSALAGLILARNKQS